MAVTKAYLARNLWLRDRVIERLGLIAGVLTVALVLLYVSGALHVGREVNVELKQPTMQAHAN
jgi:hypothetical protein